MPKAGSTTLVRKLLGHAPFDPKGKKIYEPDHASVEGRLCYILDASQYRGSPFYDVIVPEFVKSAEKVVFLVDLTNPKSFPEAKLELESILSNPYLSGKPCAVFATKSELQDAVDVNELVRALGLDLPKSERTDKFGTRIEIFSISVREDTGYKGGLRWLFNTPTSINFSAKAKTQ
ncbi:hypothetical protein HDU97_008811 [Phlyctochytrium planicorne]|nr:hypothetical protein HDU97_008811 [Phlyctochytrium planicorne]